VFAGVRGDHVERLIAELRRRSINAGTTPNLDEAVRAVIVELRIGQEGEDERDTEKYHGRETTNGGRVVVVVDKAFAAEAMDAASTGRTGVLRKLSWEHPNWIRLILSTIHTEQGVTVATTATATTCLHAAAAAGHAATVHWLVTEAGCDMLARNALGQSAGDVAANHPAVRDLLDRLQQQTQPNATTTTTVPTTNNSHHNDHSSTWDGTDSRSTHDRSPDF
jgi:hypothetical protein